MIIENLHTNPSFETASGTVTVRTNLCRNPILGTAVTDWSIGAFGAGGAATGGRVNLSSTWTWWYQMTFTTPPTAAGSAIANVAVGNSAVTPGLTYSAQIFGRVSWAGAQTAAKIFWYDSAGAFLSSGPIGTAAVHAANVTESRTVPGGVAPAGAAYARLDFYLAGGTLPPTNGTMAATAGLVENAATVGTHFDGSTGAAGDFTYAWSGTAHASTSLQQAPGVAGVTGGNAAAVQSTAWAASGVKSLRVIPTLVSATSVETYGTVTVAGLVVGQPYTVGGTVRLTAPLTGTLSPNTLGIYSVGLTSTYLTGFPQPANVAGTYQVRITFTATATAHNFRFANGASQSNGDVWWDSIFAIAGVYTGDYLDGDFPSTDTITYTWTGVSHASTSRQVTYLDGTNLTLGRFGIDITVDSVAQWDEQGNRVTISGQTPHGSVPDALTLRQQLMGYVDSPDESFVPVTWADQPSVNGYYRVLSARVDPHPSGAFAGVFLFSVELERVQGFAAPLIECIAVGKLRTSSLVLTKRPIQGVPAGARSYTEYHPETRTMVPRAIDVRRAGPTSVVSVFSDVGNDYIVGQLYLPPAKFYEGAVTVRMGGKTVVGRQTANDTTGWVLSNDMLEVRPVVGETFSLEFRRWTTTGWSAWTPFTLQSDPDPGSGPHPPLPHPHTVTVLSNSPEAVTIRLLTVDGVAPIVVDVALRRGAEHVAVELSSAYGAYYSVSIPSMTGSTAITGGFSKALTGVTAAFGSAQGTGPFVDGSDFNAGGGSPVGFVDKFPFGFGLTTGAAQTLLNEYFWAGSEKQTVVAR